MRKCLTLSCRFSSCCSMSARGEGRSVRYRVHPIAESRPNGDVVHSPGHTTQQRAQHVCRADAQWPSASSHMYGTINTDLTALSSIVQGGQALAYSLSNLDTQFRNTFTGYGATPNRYFANYKGWANTTLDTLRGTLRAAGLQGAQLSSEESVLAHCGPSAIAERSCPRYSSDGGHR